MTGSGDVVHDSQRVWSTPTFYYAWCWIITELSLCDMVSVTHFRERRQTRHSK